MVSIFKSSNFIYIVTISKFISTARSFLHSRIPVCVCVYIAVHLKLPLFLTVITNITCPKLNSWFHIPPLSPDIFILMKDTNPQPLAQARSLRVIFDLSFSFIYTISSILNHSTSKKHLKYADFSPFPCQFSSLSHNYYSTGLFQKPLN